MSIDHISKQFKSFAQRECAGSSKLYEYLSLEIAEDVEMLELSSYAKEGQPIPNLFLGAVQYLLFKGIDHELQDYYPSIVNQPKEVRYSFIPFKNFCNTYREEVISILKSRLVQTNEVRRCAYLYPVFSFIYSKRNKPLALIEIGTSAGFQLLWDKYRYSYMSNEIFGDLNSDVLIKADIKGEKMPELPIKVPPVTHRYGVDLHIMDVSCEEDSLWLKSLIWPEHKERRDLFIKAADCLINNKNELNLIEGNGVGLLPQIVAQLPKQVIVCVFHTHVANQMSNKMKHDLLENMKAIGNKRDVFHIYNNIWDKDLHLDYFLDKIEYKETIGETDGHGRWFNWNL